MAGTLLVLEKEKTSQNKKILKLHYGIKKYYFGQRENDQKY